MGTQTYLAVPGSLSRVWDTQAVPPGHSLAFDAGVQTRRHVAEDATDASREQNVCGQPG